MTNWIPSSIIYQINLRAFAAREPRNPIEAADEHAKPTSPLAYLTDNLSVLEKLGVTVLHIMPPYPMGAENRKGIGSPYASRDYGDIDPEYGSLDEFRRFVRAAHATGFKVIIGMVPNHTSRDHVWTRSNPEFYVKDAHGEIAHDLDWTDTSKLDYRVPALRKAMRDVLEFWLTLLGEDEGVDGFRFDMAHFINDLNFWNDTLPGIKTAHPRRHVLFLAECYGNKNNMDLFGRGMTAAYDDEFYKACEYFYGTDIQGVSQFIPSIEVYSHAALKKRYDLFQAEGFAGVMEAALGQYEGTLPSTPDSPRLARYTDNHDEGRGVFRYGDGAVRAVNSLLFMSPHTLPFLLAGQEFGALNRPAIHDRIRPCEKGRRILSDEGVSWMDGIEFEGNIFARGPAARAAWHTFYGDLIRLRREAPALVHGDFSVLDAGEDVARSLRAVVAFARRHEGTTLHCAVNCGPEPRRLKHANLFKGRVLHGNLQADRIEAFSSIVVEASL